MPCHAAIKAVHRTIPIATFGGRLHRMPHPGMTAPEVQRKINWWTLATINEALAALVQRGDAEFVGEPKIPMQIRYRAKIAARGDEGYKR